MRHPSRVETPAGSVLPAPTPAAIAPGLAGVGLAALLSALLQGCCTSSVCDCESVPTSEQVTALADAQLVADALQDGTLSLDECAELCAREEYQLIGCSDLGPAAQGAGGGGGGGGAGGGTGGPQHEVRCQVDTTMYCEGRRHVAVEADLTGSGPTAVAAWLSRAVRAEAASVHAFLALEQELAAHHAPRSLCQAARAAAGDEVRHARMLGGLAAAAGASAPTPPTVAPPTARSLFELALENAVEGCVHETFAALVAMHQAQHARAGAVRRVMGRVAVDEVRHGELAWAIHAWACSRLSADEVRAVEMEMTRAARALCAAEAAGSAVDSEARRVLGLPAAALAARLAGEATERLWAAAAAA